MYMSNKVDKYLTCKLIVLDNTGNGYKYLPKKYQDVLNIIKYNEFKLSFVVECSNGNILIREQTRTEMHDYKKYIIPGNNRVVLVCESYNDIHPTVEQMKVFSRIRTYEKINSAYYDDVHLLLWDNIIELKMYSNLLLSQVYFLTLKKHMGFLDLVNMINGIIRRI